MLHGKTWNFLIDLLESERTDPSVITWKNRDEGEFKVPCMSRLAELWGKGSRKEYYRFRNHWDTCKHRDKIKKISKSIYVFGSGAKDWREVLHIRDKIKFNNQQERICQPASMNMDYGNVYNFDPERASAARARESGLDVRARPRRTSAA